MQSIINGIWKKKSCVFTNFLSDGVLMRQLSPENGQTILGVGASLLTTMENLKQNFNLRACLFSDEKIISNCDIELMAGSLNDIPWKNSSFDSIIVSDVFDLNDVGNIYFGELKRVLKPCGQILIKLNISVLSLLELLLNKKRLKIVLQSISDYGFSSSSIRFSRFFESFILIR